EAIVITSQAHGIAKPGKPNITASSTDRKGIPKMLVFPDEITKRSDTENDSIKAIYVRLRLKDANIEINDVIINNVTCRKEND
ncbi:MAG: hypothetical protein RXR59_08515, partial [Sulfolobus sp.]